MYQFTATQIGWRNIASLAVGVLALLYTATNVITTCCTAGIGFLAIMSIVMDFTFFVLMVSKSIMSSCSHLKLWLTFCKQIFLAVINRSARHGCGGPAPYPRAVERGSGISGCQLYVAAWAVTIISIFLYIITMATQFIIRRRGASNRRERTNKGELVLQNVRRSI